MKRKYDYIRQLFSKYGQRTDAVFAYPCDAKRVLRRLVREAVIESWRTTIAAEPSYKDAGVLEDNVRFEANRLAKELVP